MVDVSIDLSGADLDEADLASPLVAPVVKLLRFWADKNDRAFAAEWQWVITERRASVERLRYLASVNQDVQDLAARLEELLGQWVLQVRDDYLRAPEGE